ncbi:MAG TPA: Mrp/NBP35 family ATP-binding protein [Acidimicrobiia bacterium]|nr:Mrp/NBP35 family ATP-binding protein [Acidimicrobiia bacterium]
MATESSVIEALQAVQDPELHRSVVDLQMVKSVAVNDHLVRVTVAVPTPEYPLRTELRDRVSAAVSAVPGVSSVAVDLAVMNEAEQKALVELLQPAGGGGERENPFQGARTRVLAVASGKGGVGKSSVTTNLSIALAQAGYTVAAVDADVWGFSMPRMLGIDRPPVVIDTLIVPPSAHGVKLVSMGFFAREDQPVIWRGPMLHKALEQFLTDVWWDEPQFLVVDMPPGTGDVSLSMAQFLPRAEVIVVTTPQPAAQKVAQRAAYMAQKVNLTVVGVVENMSWFRGDDGKAYDIFGAGGGQDLADTLGVPLLGRVPLVRELREGGDVGRPITVVDPDNEASQAFTEIARRVYEELAPKRVYRKELRIV